MIVMLISLKSKQFVTDIQPDADFYIRENGLQFKAQLGVAFFVFNPEKSFALFKEGLLTVK